MSRILLIAALLLSGCYHAPGGNTKPPGEASPITTAAEFAAREKFRLMAANYRLGVTKTLAGEFKEVADFDKFLSPLNEATVSAYDKLKAAQELNLPKVDADGKLNPNGEYLDWIRKPDGTPDFEATAKIWEETADGFERVAGAGK